MQVQGIRTNCLVQFPKICRNLDFPQTKFHYMDTRAHSYQQKLQHYLKLSLFQSLVVSKLWRSQSEYLKRG